MQEPQLCFRSVWGKLWGTNNKGPEGPLFTCITGGEGEYIRIHGQRSEVAQDHGVLIVRVGNFLHRDVASRIGLVLHRNVISDDLG